MDGPAIVLNFVRHFECPEDVTQVASTQLYIETYDSILMINELSMIFENRVKIFRNSYNTCILKNNKNPPEELPN